MDIEQLLQDCARDEKFRMAMNYDLLPRFIGRLVSCYVESEEIDELLEAVPSQTTIGERRLLYQFFAHYWKGSANVLEIGPFLGGTTRAIALGMLANKRRNPESKLYTYDRFGEYASGEWLAEFLKPLFEAGELDQDLEATLTSNPESVAFRSIFDSIHQPHDYGSLIVAENRALPSCKEALSDTDNLFMLSPETRFDAVFIDGCKSWFSTKHFMLEVSKCIEPGAFVISQDYGWFTCFWLPVFFSTFREHFDLIAFADSTYAFRMVKPLHSDDILSKFPDTPEDFDADFYRKLFFELIFEAGERSDIRAVTYTKLQLAGALAYIGHKDEARGIIGALEFEPSAIRHEDSIKKAMKSPTYGPQGAIELS